MCVDVVGVILTCANGKVLGVYCSSTLINVFLCYSSLLVSVAGGELLARAAIVCLHMELSSPQ